MEEEDNVIDEDKNCVIVDGCHLCCSPFEAFQDDLTADEILAQAQDAAKEAREELTLRKPNSKVRWEFAVPKYIFYRGGITVPSQFPPSYNFPDFLLLSKHWLPIEYHIHIWQVSPQLSCGDTCQIEKLLKIRKNPVSGDCALFSLWTCVESMCHLFIHCLVIVRSGDFYSQTFTKPTFRIGNWFT